MLYHFYVFYKVEGQEAHTEYVTDFSGVSLLAQLLEKSGKVIQFVVSGEGRASLPQSRFDLNGNAKWAFGAY